MQAASEFSPRLVARSTTPKTDAAKFTITTADVGTLAVRHGIAMDLEQERYALLLAAKTVLIKIRSAGIGIGAAQEAMLEAAVRMAEAGDRA